MPPATPGFVKSLFDLSFSKFVTGSVVKVLYVLLLIVGGLGAAAGVFGGFASIIAGASSRIGGAMEIFMGIGTIVLTPIGFVLYIIMVRIYMELLIVVFRIAEHLAEINRKTRG